MANQNQKYEKQNTDLQMSRRDSLKSTTNTQNRQRQKNSSKIDIISDQ